jgi:hypothetical protein
VLEKTTPVGFAGALAVGPGVGGGGAAYGM